MSLTNRRSAFNVYFRGSKSCASHRRVLSIDTVLSLAYREITFEQMAEEFIAAFIDEALANDDHEGFELDIMATPLGEAHLDELSKM